jgi:hypothetical protein
VTSKNHSEKIAIKKQRRRERRGEERVRNFELLEELFGLVVRELRER